MPRRPRSGGFTLLETLVALLLATLLGTTALRTYGALRSGVGRVVRRSAALEAVRVTRGVLRSELGTGAPGIDWTVFTPESIAVRAFRGVALVCGEGPDSSVVVLRSGRLPDPDKDSVLILGAEGSWHRADLERRVADGACPIDTGGALRIGEEAESWTLRPAPARPVLIRYFERGSYHLVDGALRYRRGAGGRQPLTDVLFTRPSLAAEAGRLRAHLDPSGVQPRSVPIGPAR